MTQTSNRLGLLKKIITASLGADASNSVTICGVNASSVTLSCTDASSATRLRLLSDTLIQSIQAHPEFANIIHIQCKVVKPQQQSRETPKATRQNKPISNSIKLRLNELAESLEDEDLKQAVNKLANS